MDIRTYSVDISHGVRGGGGGGGGAEGAGKCIFHEFVLEQNGKYYFSIRNMYCWTKILSNIVVG